MYRQVLEDLTFENGFLLKHTDGLVTRGNVREFTLCNTAKSPARWHLAQWCCNFNLAQGSEFVNYDNSVSISDPTKTVRTFRNGRIYLELRASMEYQHLRRDGEGWPHILIEQEFTSPAYLHKAKKLLLGLDFTVSNLRNGMRPDEQQHIHCAQFQYIFAVADVNPASEGFGDYYWFNFSLLDTRYEFPPAFMQQDGGKEENTGKFIYVPEMSEILKTPVVPCRRRSIEFDVKPEMEKAFKIAKQRGFLPKSRYEDIAVKNTNIGWEVTGTFDVGVDIEKISFVCDE